MINVSGLNKSESYIPHLASYMPSKRTWLRGFNCAVALAVFTTMVTTQAKENYPEQSFDVLAHAAYALLPENPSPLVKKIYNTLEVLRLGRTLLNPIIGTSFAAPIIGVLVKNFKREEREASEENAKIILFISSVCL